MTITPVEFLKLIAQEAKLKQVTQSAMLSSIVELLKIDGFFESSN